MPEFGLFLPLLSLLISVTVAGAVTLAFVGNKNKGLSEVQTSTITALQAQNVAQEAQIKILDKKVMQLERTLRTVQYTLRKRRRLQLEINGETITIVDERTGSELTVPIHTGPLEKIDKEEA